MATAPSAGKRARPGGGAAPAAAGAQWTPSQVPRRSMATSDWRVDLSASPGHLCVVARRRHDPEASQAL